MAPERRHHHHHHNRRVAKKRVRILPGHEARFIEKRRSPPRRANRVQKRARTKPKTATTTTRTMTTAATSRGGKLGRGRTHKPTVAELVYRYLESVSNRGVCKSQKSSATSQFRRQQRRLQPRRIRPDQRQHQDGLKCIDVDDGDAGPIQVGYDEFKREPASPCCANKDIHSYNGAKRNIEKCIYEIISIGTVLGLLQPVDKRGLVFRIAPELKLFSKSPEKQPDGNDWDVDRKY